MKREIYKISADVIIDKDGNNHLFVASRDESFVACVYRIAFQKIDLPDDVKNDILRQVFFDELSLMR